MHFHFAVVVLDVEGSLGVVDSAYAAEAPRAAALPVRPNPLTVQVVVFYVPRRHGLYARRRDMLLEVAILILEREDPEDRARLRGLVSNIDAANNSFEIQGVSISVQDGITQFEDDDENLLSLSEFFDLLTPGDEVSARWDVFSSTSVVADEVEIDD